MKTETLLEDGRAVLSDNISDSSSDRDCKPSQPHPQQSQIDSFAALSREHLLHGNGLHHVREHEALQVGILLVSLLGETLGKQGQYAPVFLTLSVFIGFMISAKKIPQNY